MTSGATPQQVWEQALRHHQNRDLDGFVGMFAIDGVMELPFAFEGFPSRLAGREEIRRTLAPWWNRAGSARRVLGYETTAVHQARDPEVVVVEFEVHGEADGHRHRLPYAHVVRARAGVIISLRDYFDSALLAARIQADTLATRP